MTQPFRLPVSHFYNPIMAVLSRHTLSPGQLIRTTEDLQKEICREAGYDPDNLSQYGTEYDGWFWLGSRPQVDGNDQETNGIRRKIQIAYRQLWNRRVPLTQEGCKGWWGLTDEGLVAGRKLSPCEAPVPVYMRQIEEALEEPLRASMNLSASQGPNATARFLTQRLSEPGNKLLETMRRYLMKAMPVSAMTGMIDDHLNNCICKLIARDALAGRLQAGEEIKDHHIATWAVRSAYGDIRTDGTEPVARELYGARTERERKLGIELGDLSDSRLLWERDEGSEGWVDLVDTESALTAHAAEDAMQFEQVWGQIEQIIQSKRTPVGDRYLSILRKRTMGLSVKEIADEEGISPNRATVLIAEAKKAVQSRLRRRIGD